MVENDLCILLLVGWAIYLLAAFSSRVVREVQRIVERAAVHCEEVVAAEMSCSGGLTRWGRFAESLL